MSFQSQEAPRRQIDASKSVTLALPIISATVNTNIIDLECVNTFPSLEQVNFVASTASATANSGNAAAINCIMQHCADTNTANFANVSGQALLSIASNAAVYPATNLVFAVPPTGLLRYVRLQVAQAAGGSNAANTSNITFSLAF
jgi:hypothetical protein